MVSLECSLEQLKNYNSLNRLFSKLDKERKGYLLAVDYQRFVEVNDIDIDL